MQAKLIIAAAVAILLAAMGGYILLLKAQKHALVAEQAQWKQAYSIAAQTAVNNQAVVDAQLAEAKRLDAILAQRNRQRAAAVAKSQLMEKALDDLKRDHAEIRNWADVPTPDGVREYLAAGNRKNGSGEAVPPGGTDAGNAAPGGSVSNERRPADHD